MSLRAGLQTWYRVAALLVAAAIVLAAPYGVAVAMRSGIASIILRKAETAISGAAVDTSASAPATGWEGRQTRRVQAHECRVQGVRRPACPLDCAGLGTSEIGSHPHCKYQNGKCRLLRRVLGDRLLVGRGLVLKGGGMRHGDDVVAGIDEVHVPGDAG
jgi:hypothetical protein